MKLIDVAKENLRWEKAGKWIAYKQDSHTHSTLQEVFKQYVGVTPQEYRSSMKILILHLELFRFRVYCIKGF